MAPAFAFTPRSWLDLSSIVGSAISTPFDYDVEPRGFDNSRQMRAYTAFMEGSKHYVNLLVYSALAGTTGSFITGEKEWYPLFGPALLSGLVMLTNAVRSKGHNSDGIIATVRDYLSR